MGGSEMGGPVLEAAREPLDDEPNVLEMLEHQWADGKFLCVGLDVTPDDSMDAFEKARLIVDATRDIAAAFKPNSAFYESMGKSGIAQLERVVGYIKALAPEVPVLWDAKRADIGNTNKKYSDAAEGLGVDGITLNPYLGGSALKPLLSDPGRMGIVLAHTSNAGAGEFQNQQLMSGEFLWERVVSNVADSDDWHHGSPLGIVMGATYPDELAKARYLAGDDIVMLVPGVGTQGGDLEASVRGAMNSRGNGFLINVSSGISKAADASTGEVTTESVRQAAIRYHEEIKTVWQDEISHPTPNYETRNLLEFNARLATALADEGCIRFGDFILKDQSSSPVYIDLRRTITDPELRGDIVNIYRDLILDIEETRGEPFDVLAGMPQAVTSLAAVTADRMGRRLIQPRSGGPKDHGGSANIEGVYREGESVGMIDDVIQSGGSKITGISQIQEAGLQFGGWVVLVDREGGGFRDMAKMGVPTSAATTLRALIRELRRRDRVPKQFRESVEEYLG